MLTSPTRIQHMTCAPSYKQGRRIVLRDGVHSISFLFFFHTLLQHGRLLSSLLSRRVTNRV